LSHQISTKGNTNNAMKRPTKKHTIVLRT